MLSIRNLPTVRNKEKVSSVKIRRAEEVANEINRIVKDKNNSKYLFLIDCYAKDGEIYLKDGKLPILPNIYTPCFDKETLRIYNIAVDNNRTMSNARLLLRSNEKFAENFNKQTAKYHSFYRCCLSVSPDDGNLTSHCYGEPSILCSESLQNMYDRMNADDVIKGIKGKGTIRTLKKYLLEVKEPKKTSHDKVSNYLKIGGGTFVWLAGAVLSSILPLMLGAAISTFGCLAAFVGIDKLKKISKAQKKYQNDLLNKISESNVMAILKRATKNEKLTAEEAITIIKNKIPFCNKNVTKYVSYRL